MTYVYITLGYLGIGAFLVLFYIGAAGYPHRFAWKMLIQRLFKEGDVWWAMGLIVIWLPLLFVIFIKGLINKITITLRRWRCNRIMKKGLSRDSVSYPVVTIRIPNPETYDWIKTQDE